MIPIFKNIINTTNTKCILKSNLFIKIIYRATMLGEMLKITETLAENKVNNQSKWLIQGVKSKIYQPLLKRPASGIYIYKMFENNNIHFYDLIKKVFFTII